MVTSNGRDMFWSGSFRARYHGALLNILTSGECIEDYPDDYPFPSGLFFGWHGAKPLHVVAALEETRPRVYIITAYEPDLEHFENDFRTRRKK
jgi:Domain of unknown function (DUF4258)